MDSIASQFKKLYTRKIYFLKLNTLYVSSDLGATSNYANRFRIWCHTFPFLFTYKLFIYVLIIMYISAITRISEKKEEKYWVKKVKLHIYWTFQPKISVSQSLDLKINHLDLKIKKNRYIKNGKCHCCIRNAT